MVDDLRRLIPSQIRRSYAAKFGIVLLVIGISVGMIGSAATVKITNEVQNNVDDEYRGLATQEANTLEQWLERNRLTTRLTSEADVLTRDRTNLGRGEPIRDYLRAKQSQSPGDVSGMHVVEMDSSEIIESTSSELDTSGDSTVDATDQPWWGVAQAVDESGNADDVEMTGVYRDSRGRSVISFAAPVSNTNRVMVVTFRTAPVAQDNFQGGSRTPGGFTQIIDENDQIVFDERVRKTLDPYPDDAREPIELANQLRQDDTVGAGVTTMSANPDVFYENQKEEFKNDDYVVGYAPVDGTDWVVLVHAPQSEAYGFVTTVSQFGLLATLAGMLLIAVLGTFLGRNTASAIDRLTAKTQRMEAGDLSVDFETERIDNIGRLYEAFGSMRDALREQIQEAQAARREAEEARESAEMMTQHLVEKADAYSEVMEAVGDGDMTRRMDPESRSDAMQRIAFEFNEMIDEIEATTEQVKEFATDVATSSEEVTASSEEVKSASEQVTESIQEISDGAERQNDQLQSVSNEMNSLSTTIEEIASSANEVADLSQQTAETGEDARESAEQAIDEMETVEGEAEATVAAMEDLQEQMEQIEEITEFITDVAEQTNILALNANIEAARAGEAGEGFAVVADEVKGLAEDTRDAAEEIDELVENLRDQTETTAEEVQQTSEEVARSTEIVGETVDSLEKIAGYAQETNTGVQEISDATTEQASSTNQVVGMVDEAASISEQTSQESENVAAAAEEQTTALTEVTNSASALAEQASRLSSALERFETDADGSEAEGASGADDSDVDNEQYVPDDETAEAPSDEESGAEPVTTAGDDGGDESEAEPEIVDALGVDMDPEVTGDIEVGDIDAIVDDVDADGAESDEADGSESADGEAIQADSDADAAGSADPRSGSGDGGDEATRPGGLDRPEVPDVVDELTDPDDAPGHGGDAGDDDGPAGEDVETEDSEDDDGDDEGAEAEGTEADGDRDVDESNRVDDGDGSDHPGAAEEPSADAEDGDGIDDAIDEWLEAQGQTVDELPEVDGGSPDGDGDGSADDGEE